MVSGSGYISEEDQFVSSVNTSGAGLARMAGFTEHANELSVSARGEDLLSDYQRLNIYSVL
jgi:hypothetical protein